MPLGIYFGAQLASASVWAIAGLLPPLRGTTRSPGGVAFSTFCLLVSSYCILDMFYLLASEPSEALLLVRARGAAITLAALFLFLFSKWLTTQRRRVDVLATIPAIAMAGLAATAVSTSVLRVDWGFAPVRNTMLYLPWIATVVGYALAGVAYLWRGASQIREESRSQRFRIKGVVVGIIIAVLVGLLGNVASTLQGVQTPPLFSSLLVLPGAVLLVFLLPIDRERLSHYVRGLVRTRGEVLHAFLIYHGGSLIASRSLEESPGVDEDIFSGVLEAIQRFVNVGFGGAGYGWMDAIEHGDLKLLIERGRYCSLVLVTTGREDDLLRGEMRDVLMRFEERNSAILPDWNGDTEVLRGAQDAINVFFDLVKVF